MLLGRDNIEGDTKGDEIIMKKSVAQLLMIIYGGRADAHLDLYRLSNQHRSRHGRDCDMYPSDPLQAPLWRVVATLTHARRILEVGCGHGYTAAVMASAAGPDCHVDTIEASPQHAALAEQAFQERDLSRRISVLHGRGQNILPRLKGRYDVVFLDGDWRNIHDTFRIYGVSRVPAALL